MNYIEIGNAVNKFKRYVNNMIITYLIITGINIILCGIISMNGYNKQHLYLSLIIISANTINFIYYFCLGKFIYKIFGVVNTTSQIRNHLKAVRKLTYTDILVNCIILVVISVLFSSWIDKRTSEDNIILIVEYILIIIVNSFSIGFSITTLFCLRNLFNPERYILTTVI